MSHKFALAFYKHNNLALGLLLKSSMATVDSLVCVMLVSRVHRQLDKGRSKDPKESRTEKKKLLPWSNKLAEKPMQDQTRSPKKQAGK